MCHSFDCAVCVHDVITRRCVVVHGWLGDSVLVSSDFDADAFCSSMAEVGIYITVRELAKTPEQYYECSWGSSAASSTPIR